MTGSLRSFQKESYLISLLIHLILLLFFWQSIDDIQSKNKSVLEVQMVKVKAPKVAPKKQVSQRKKTKSRQLRQRASTAPKSTSKPNIKSSPKPKQEIASTAPKAPSVFPGDQSRPSILRKNEVPYPKSAQNQELEGKVIVEVLISKTGAVLSSKIIQSSGHPLLDQTFINSLKTYEFAAKQVSGVKENGRLIVSHLFSLE